MAKSLVSCFWTHGVTLHCLAARLSRYPFACSLAVRYARNRVGTVIGIVLSLSYDSVLQRAKISLRNIVSQFTNIVSDDLTISQANRT